MANVKREMAAAMRLSILSMPENISVKGWEFHQNALASTAAVMVVTLPCGC